MNKITLSIASLLLSALVLAACGNQETTKANNKASATPSHTAESDTPGAGPVTVTDNHSAPISSDSIKWEEIQDPLIDEAMKDKLKASVEAIVNKDVAAFHKTLGPEAGTVHDYLLDNPVKFTDVGGAVEENGRILVPVNGEYQSSDRTVPEMSYTFYFEPDQSGDWQIIVID